MDFVRTKVRFQAPGSNDVVKRNLTVNFGINDIVKINMTQATSGGVVALLSTDTLITVEATEGAVVRLSISDEDAAGNKSGQSPDLVLTFPDLHAPPTPGSPTQEGGFESV